MALETQGLMMMSQVSEPRSMAQTSERITLSEDIVDDETQADNATPQYFKEATNYADE